MEQHTEKIRRFSKIVHIILKVAFVVYVVAGVIEVVSWSMSALMLHTDTFIFSGRSIQAPLLFQIGEFKVYLPIFFLGEMGEPGIDLSQFDFLTISLGDVLGTAFTIVVLAYAKSLFRALRDNGSPFHEDFVLKFKRLAIALLCTGVVTGILGFLAAGIVWVLCLIFDYGCALQNESDTTL
ncbi:hypothetical protein FACS18948_0980 [Clostridia bacterium]|nr:hypothetical protein FACS18948_0980 [Clostridia bacterium]